MYCVTGTKESKALDCAWSARDLRANIGAQSKLHLRPVQKNLSTESIVPENRPQVKEKCNICCKEVLMKDLRHHVYLCKILGLGVPGTSSSYSDPEDEWAKLLSSLLLIPSRMGHGNEKNSAILQQRIENTPSQIQVNEERSTPAPQRREENPTSGSAEGGPGNYTDCDVNPQNTSVPSAEQPKNTEDLSVGEGVKQVVSYCMKENVNNPVEILKSLQKKMVCGQALEVTDVSSM